MDRSQHGEAGQSTRRPRLHERLIREIESELEGPPEEGRPPLFDVVDLEAADRLFTSAADAAEPGLRLSFMYCGCRVTVDGDGSISVTQER